MLLPAGLRQTMYSLLTSDRRRAEEIRLRVGRCPAVVLPEGEIAGGSNPVTAADLAGVLDLATGASVHAARRSMAEGYVTAKGGYRVGICGTAVVQAGEVTGFRSLSSVSIRIPRQIPRAGTSCCQHQSKTIFSRASLRSQNASSCGIGFSPVHPWVHIVSTRE